MPDIVLLVVPSWVRVPRDDVDLFGQLAVIEAFDHMHVRRERQRRVRGSTVAISNATEVRASGPYTNLPPIEIMAMHTEFAVRCWRDDLLPSRNTVWAQNEVHQEKLSASSVSYLSRSQSSERLLA